MSTTEGDDQGCSGEPEVPDGASVATCHRYLAVRFLSQSSRFFTSRRQKYFESEASDKPPGIKKYITRPGSNLSTRRL